VAAFISSSAKGQMNDEFGDAGLKIFQRRFVEFGPLFWRDGRGDGDGVVETMSAEVKLDSR